MPLTWGLSCYFIFVGIENPSIAQAKKAIRTIPNNLFQYALYEWQIRLCVKLQAFPSPLYFITISPGPCKFLPSAYKSWCAWNAMTSRLLVQPKSVWRIVAHVRSLPRSTPTGHATGCAPLTNSSDAETRWDSRLMLLEIPMCMSAFGLSFNFR